MSPEGLGQGPGWALWALTLGTCPQGQKGSIGDPGLPGPQGLRGEVGDQVSGCPGRWGTARAPYPAPTVVPQTQVADTLLASGHLSLRLPTWVVRAVVPALKAVPLGSSVIHPQA